MILWILIAVLTTAVAAWLMLPLLRQSSPDLHARVDYDIVVYRDQLAEVDQEVEQGLLTSNQANAARAEIHRRMLASEDIELAAPAPLRYGNRVLRLATIVIIAVTVPLGALSLYYYLGAPALPDKPYAWRQTNDPQFLSATSAESLRALLESNPSAEGYRSLASMYFTAGDYQNAADAGRRAIELGDNDAAAWSELGEAIIMANGGFVVPEALEAFIRSLELEPMGERSRFYIGLAETQIGNMRKAVAFWRDLEQTSDANAPWLPLVREHIEAAAQQGGFDANSVAPERASAESLKSALSAMNGAISNIAPATSSAVAPAGDPTGDMIRGMVAKLAAEMKSNPNDAAGWARLANAYNVLNEPAEAKAAIDHAVALQPNNPDFLLILAETERARSPDGEKAPAFVAAMRKVLTINAGDPQALYYVGLAEQRNGNTQTATDMWRKALAGLEANDPLAAQIRSALDSLSAK